MEFSSRVYTCPSFNRYSSNSIADIADRVVEELSAENEFNDDDVFSFSDDVNQADIGDGDGDGLVNKNPDTDMMNRIEEDEHEFEFSVICGDCNLHQVSIDESVSDDQISPRYPLFGRSLSSDVDFNHLCDGVDTSKTGSKPPPATRSSLMKLFNEDRDTDSTSSSEVEADELDGITPGTYCVWKPKTESHGNHKKSNSISIGNTSNRWKVRDLIKRSYSDVSYSTGKDSPVFLFIPPISPEKVNKTEKTAKLGSIKTEKKIPAYKSKIGNTCLPTYLPYRQDQVAAFTNFAGKQKSVPILKRMIIH